MCFIMFIPITPQFSNDYWYITFPSKLPIAVDREEVDLYCFTKLNLCVDLYVFIGKLLCFWFLFQLVDLAKKHMLRQAKW